MHVALARLLDADADVERARRALEAAQDRRRECAVALSEIEDPDERLEAAIFANETLKGLSVALAQAVTGLPGKRGQSKFLQLAGRIPPSAPKPKRRRKSSSPNSEPPISELRQEWPAPSALERDVILSHIQHGRAYPIGTGIGWTSIHITLSPAEAAAYLEDPSAVMARKFGVSRDEFCEWFATDGSLACEGALVNGGSCRVLIGSQLPIEIWKKAKVEGGYCRRHAGVLASGH